MLSMPGAINQSYCSMSVRQLFADCFLHLGQKVLYQSKNKEQSYFVRVLKTQPDKLHKVGDGKFIGEMLFLEVNVFDVLQPTIGDIFVINDRKYKVHSPPLRDNSGIVWNIECTVFWKKDT